MTVDRRAAERFAQLVRDADLQAFGASDRALLRLGALAAPRASRLVMPLVRRRLRAEAGGVVLPAEDPALRDHLGTRSRQGFRSNINVLGEAILGDDEAQRRSDMIAERLRRPDVGYVSVKISAICPSISALAFDDTVARVGDRLRPLLRIASGFDPPKFVNLDMEEYHDLDLTVSVFRGVLDEAEFGHLDAGIVLQAYLPDVRDVAFSLGEWAVARRRRAGGRIKVRLVKGANLAMEHAAAELAGWTAAPYSTKADVDANYKAVLDVLCDPRFDDAVRVGVGTHNLFDVAWALGLRAEMIAAGRPGRLELEMLEGMSPSQAEVVRSEAGDLLLYSPIVAPRDFPAAVAYLVRRLDENTSPDNFLAHLFEITDDAVFDAEAARFADAVRARRRVDGTPRRRQDRHLPPDPSPDSFVNAPDTDWTRALNRAWLDAALSVGLNAPAEPRVAGVVTIDEVDRAVERAGGAVHGWSSRGAVARAAVIDAVGTELELRRGDALRTMARETGKAIAQGDPEVSEAVDFARYYARCAVELDRLAGVQASPLGTVVVTPPWNFPFAIPAGGVLAALAAGNAVVLKPAPQSRATARLVAECCWAAGVPDDVLQFVPADDDDAGRRLVSHPDVDAVILTGAHETAMSFLRWRPDLRLHAETSGKNALVISAAADIDEAVADLVASAFGHAGQKCSAASLAIVDAPLYDDPVFFERVRDAAATMRVGPATDPATDIGPLIEPPAGKLLRALTELDEGERWLLEPECRSDDRRLWSPGIRIGVRPGSWFARTECFGPVLGMVRYDGIDEAIAIQNGSEYGLTAGLHSLDPHEVETWVDAVEAGNLYVNRGITGAIVRRQPFGGWKRSIVGPTAKAGGPNYVATLCRWSETEQEPLPLVVERFERWWRDVGSVAHDPTGLLVERNDFRYRRLPGGVAVRFGPATRARDRELVTLAARTTGCRLVRSDATDESDTEFAARLAGLGVDRYRAIGFGRGDRGPGEVLVACHRLGIAVDDSAPVGSAEIELPRWLREQAVSVTTHRHGRIDRRATAGTSVGRR